MKIKILDNASAKYRWRAMNSKTINWDWYDKLKKINGKTIEVDTEYLFEDQYNTVAIKGVSENGLRIRQESIDEVIDDIRLGLARCDWCGVTTKQNEPCVKCGKTEYLKAIDYFTKNINKI